MKFTIKEYPEFSFGFDGFNNTKKPAKEVEPKACTSDHGHCWEAGPILLSYPPIHTYHCVHCSAYKTVSEKRRSACKYDK